MLNDIIAELVTVYKIESIRLLKLKIIVIFFKSRKK